MTDTTTETRATKASAAPEAVTGPQPVNSDAVDFAAVTARWSGKAMEPAKAPVKASSEITERVRGSDGKFASTKAKPAEKAEDGAGEPQEDGAAPTGEAAESQEDQPTPEAGGDDQNRKVRDAEWRSALRVLELEGWSSDVADALDRTAALKNAAQVAKHQAKRDAEFRKRDDELKELKLKLEKATAGTERKPTAPTDLKPAAMEFVKQFGLDEEAGPALEKLLGDVHSSAHAMVESFRQEVDKDLNNTRAVQRYLAISEARRDLVERFPGLADRAAFRAVYEEAEQRLAANLHAESEDPVYEAVVRATMALGISEAPRSPSNGQERSKRERGQPTAPARAQSRSDETPAETDRRAYLEARKRFG